MAEHKAGGSTGQYMPERAVASVTDAVRVATEASLLPALRPSARREAAAAKTSARANAVPALVVPQSEPEPEPALTAGSLVRAAAAAADTDIAPGAAVTAASATGAVLEVAMPEEVPPIQHLPSVSTEVDTEVDVPTPVPNRLNVETIMTTAEDLMSFQQGNFEALMKSGQIWAAGLQDLGRHFAASAQAQMDETMGNVKAMTSVKSLREAVELQSTLTRTSMEKVVTEGGKITDATMKLAEQTMAPITARLTLAAERFGRTAA